VSSQPSFTEALTLQKAMPQSLNLAGFYEKS